MGLTLVKCKKKYFFLLTFFWHILTTLAFKPNVDLSPNMYFLSHTSIHAFFLLFHLNFIYTKNLCCPSRIICYLHIYIFIGMIIILSFQSHQTCILSAGLGMAWNPDYANIHIMLMLIFKHFWALNEIETFISDRPDWMTDWASDCFSNCINLYINA